MDPNFTRNIETTFGKAGRQWLEDLPSLLNQAAQKWDLALGRAFLLSYNYVTSAKRRDGSDVVLKIGVPNPEFKSELAALRCFAGDGCVRLLDSDEENYMFVMERLSPGRMLTSVNDDEKRTNIACDVMQHLWRPIPDGLDLINLRDWFAAFPRLRKRFGGGSGPLPKELLLRAEALIPVLFAQSSPSVLMHGDLHHFNILSSGLGWLAIDPKGVTGPAEYECGPLLINPMPQQAYRPDALAITGRRIAILSERLGFPRERIRDWGFCHAILSACWDLADDNTGGEYSRACAEIILKAEI